MWGYGPGMMGYGYGWGGHMFLGALFWVAILALAVYAVGHLFRASSRDGVPRQRGSSALCILEERYARGEIGRDEYLEKKADISGSGESRK
jgi:putative membrane protein